MPPLPKGRWQRTCELTEGYNSETSLSCPGIRIPQSPVLRHWCQPPLGKGANALSYSFSFFSALKRYCAAKPVNTPVTTPEAARMGA